MKTIILFCSLLLLCFLNLKAQVPDLPLSFTNEEVGRFKESVEVYCLPITTNELESAQKKRPEFVGCGRILNINILQDVPKMNIEGGNVYIFKAEPPDIHHLIAQFDLFFASESSYMFIYNEFNDNHDDFFLVSTINQGKFRQHGAPSIPYIGNRLVIEFFESDESMRNSKIIITTITQAL